MQKKLILPLLLLPFLILYTSYSIHAAPSPSPSPLPSPSPASIDEVTANLKERLQNSLQNLNGSTASPSATSYVGIVTDVVGGTVVISDKDGKKDIKLADNATILRTPGNAVIKPEDIRIDDSMIALGYSAGPNVLTGKRIIVNTIPFPAFKKISALGIIKNLTKSILTLTIGDQTQVVGLTGKTIFKTPAGLLDAPSLSPGDTVIYTAVLDDSGAQTASVVMRIAQSSINQ